jgi:hypothetical protein
MSDGRTEPLSQGFKAFSLPSPLQLLAPVPEIYWAADSKCLIFGNYGSQKSNACGTPHAVITLFGTSGPPSNTGRR